MKMPLYLLILSLGLGLPGVAAAAWSGNLNAFLGGKALDKDDWNADEQAEIGVALDFRQPGWPFSIAADVHFTEGDFKGLASLPGQGTGFLVEDVHTCDFNLGLRKYWEGISNARPFLGGGLAYGQLEVDRTLDGVPIQSDKGNGVGVWVGGGMLWSINAFNVGFDLRYTRIEVGLDAGDVESGGGHAGLLVGYHW
jgi:hypothetical protein